MNTKLISIFTTNLPTRRGALTFFWIAISLVSLSIVSIGVAEAFMPDNIHGREAVLTFYRSFGSSALFWSIGAMCSLWYLQYVKSRGRKA